MNNVKFVSGVFLAVGCFAAGIYFQSYLPEAESSRELSSLSAPGKREPSAIAKYDSHATDAFKACIDSRIQNNNISIGKTLVEGRQWSIVSIACMGTVAKQLYESMQPYSTEEYVRYRDGRRGVVRFFGRLFPPSQCVQLVGNAKGKELNDYSCSIRIDVDHEITEELKL